MTTHCISHFTTTEVIYQINLVAKDFTIVKKKMNFDLTIGSMID